MKVSIRYFASIREALGARETIDVDEGSSIGVIRDVLIARDSAHADALSRGKALRTALEQVLSDETAIVSEGAELAFFPPVTGG
jgi:molybdopterin synthase sulfur carrier subunit